MFIGEFTHKLDKKGRLLIPKKFRSDLEHGAVVTRGLDNCLFLYTQEEWEELAEELADLPFAKANSRAFTRLMLAGAMDVDIDSKGRIMVPDYLRDFADLEKEVVIAGLYDRLEIWNKQAWEEYKEKTENSSGEIAERMSELGI